MCRKAEYNVKKKPIDFSNGFLVILKFVILYLRSYNEAQH